MWNVQKSFVQENLLKFLLRKLITSNVGSSLGDVSGEEPTFDVTLTYKTRSYYRKESAAWMTKWSPNNMLLKNSGYTLILYL